MPKQRVAVLDLNNGVPNLGLGSILELIETLQPPETGDDGPSTTDHRPTSVEVFDVRAKGEIPGLDHDVYISTGGPGSPFDGEGTPWESRYFEWLEKLHSHNANACNGTPRKDVLFICHSFELMIRFFGLASLDKRRSPSFGVFPVHQTEAGKTDPVIGELDDPFYAADFRDWQVVEADEARFEDLAARILACEKIRDHVPLERAVMAVRVGEAMLGVQFHPEASADGMALHFLKHEKMKQVVKTYGADTYHKMLALLEQPETLEGAFRIIPNFLRQALAESTPTQF